MSNQPRQSKNGADEATNGVENVSVVGAETGSTELSVFDEWMSQCGWRKPFMPRRSSRFWEPGETKEIQVGRTIVEEMTVEEKHESKEILPNDVKSYSQDFGYVPEAFKNEKISLLEDYDVTDCRDCSGDGRLRCQTEQTCSRCNGAGQTQRHCRDCQGTGRQTRSSRTSHSETGVLWDTEYASSTTTYQVDCGSCDGGGWISERCGTCRGSGAVKCSKCKGSGYVTCKRCRGGGEVVDATLLHRSFKCSTSQSTTEETVPAKYLKVTSRQVV